ncbi:MAG: D-alanine--D-alanine ligase [Calditrichia bacterium]
MNKYENLKVLIAYNEPFRNDGDHLEFISQAAVREEAEGVYNALQNLGLPASFLPVSDFESSISRVRAFSPDVIFNLCEGYRGDAHLEMHMAALWEMLGIPYTGNPPLTLGLAQNKILTKQLLQANHIPTPDYEVFTAIPGNTSLDFPLIAKPAMEDASVGITQNSVINNPDELQQSVGELLAIYKQPVLVEKFIGGREFNISIFGNNPPQVLPISEINFQDLEAHQHAITSYEAKWLPEHPLFQKTPPVCPAPVSGQLKQRLEETALRVYQIIGGRDYGRVDLRTDQSGGIFVLEYNPNPDICPDAGYSRALAAADIKYQDFVLKIIRDAKQRMNND